MKEKLEETFTKRIENEINLKLKKEFNKNEVIFKYYDGHVYYFNKNRTCDMKVMLKIDGKLYEVVHTEKDYIGTAPEDVYNMCVDFAYEILKIKEIKMEIKVYTTYTYDGITYTDENIKEFLYKKIDEYLRKDELYNFGKVTKNIIIENKEEYYFNGIRTTLYGSLIVSGLMEDIFCRK